MPAIPLIETQIGATGPLPESQASGAAFGENIGAAMERAGNQAVQAGQYLAIINERKRTEERGKESTTKVAQFDYTGRYLELQRNSAANGAGFGEAVRRDYTDRVEQYVRDIPDDKTRTAVRASLIARLPSWSGQAAQFQFKTGVQHSTNQADEALGSLQNKVRADPAQFEQAVTDGRALIAARTELPAAQREAMAKLMEQNLARSRFEAMGTAAKTPEEMDGIIAELRDEKSAWQKRLTPADYARLTTGLEAAKRSLSVQQDAQTRAMLQDVDVRTKNGAAMEPGELAAIEKHVRQSKNPTLQWQWADLHQKQQLLRTYPAGTPPSVLQAAIQAQRAGTATATARHNFPAPVAAAITKAAAATGVSPAYLAGTLGREYSARDMAAGNFNIGNKAGASSARGVGQFIDATWLSLLRRTDVRQAMGVPDGLNDAQLLALRGDPEKSIIAMAISARDNKRYMEFTLKRPVAESELYSAHFLGAGGAVTLARAVASDPDQIAATILPGAAAANPTVFNRDGRALTVRELQGRLAGRGMSTPGRLAYSGAAFLEAQAKNQQKAIKENFAEYLNTTPQFQLSPITPQSTPEDYAARGAAIRTGAEMYGTSVGDVKVLTKQETEGMLRTIKEGTANEVGQLMGRLMGLGDGVAQAAFKQLGETDGVFEHAARLYAGGNPGVGLDVIRGRKAVNEDKNLKDAVGLKDRDLDDAMTKELGRSLFGLPDRERALVRDAAVAHFAQTYIKEGGGALKGAFDNAAREAFRSSVNAVLGGTATSKALGTVNGHQTLLPKGVTEREMDTAVDNIAPQDLVRLSVTGEPPKFRDGSPADPDAISTEGRFEAVGGNKYRIRMADGGLLLSSSAGQLGQPYLIDMSPDNVRDLAKRRAASAPTPGLPMAPPVTENALPEPLRVRPLTPEDGPEGVAPLRIPGTTE